MGDLIQEYDNVKVFEAQVGKLPKYVYTPPQLSEQESAIVAHSHSIVGETHEVLAKLHNIRTSKEREQYLMDYVWEKIKSHDISEQNRQFIIHRILDDLFLGYGRIGPLMRDDMLEEIMINGINSPLFVVHRNHGMCTSNIAYEDLGCLNDFVHWLANYVGRDLNEKNPLLDAHMPDGSRANVAIPPAAPSGPSVTIRKFKKVPFTLLDLIEAGTLNIELASFMWLCVEGLGLSPAEIIIAGGAGSGKTTLMNALAMLVPKTERVITVEDTLELNFDFIDNWVPLEASPFAMGYTGLSMGSLLKNSLRMRPDRVIVGEVRSSEAETLFVAMDIGLDGSMGTLHANNARETTIRLMGDPMNVPIRMMPLLDIIVVCNRIFSKGKIMRRVTQIAEVSGIEGDVVQLGDLFTYDVSTDTIRRSNYPILLLDKMAKECGISKKRLNTELLIRERVLEFMIANGIRQQKDVIDFFQLYHSNPKEILSMMKEFHSKV